MTRLQPLAMFKHNEAFWYICVPHSSVPEIFLLYYLLSSNVFHFDYFCFVGKSQKFVLLYALTDISKMDSLTGQQLIKADGSSHAAEAALDGKVSSNAVFNLPKRINEKPLVTW